MNHTLGDSTVPLRILIAENDRESALTLTMVLRQAGHDVHSVNTGREALAAVREFDPDVVLLDIALPELGGLEVVHKITGRNHKRPLIIGVSRVFKVGSRILSDISGFHHYLMKPYLISDVLKLIAPVRV